MLKRKELLKKAHRKFVEGSGNEILYISIEEREASSNGKSIDLSKIKCQKDWDNAKYKAGLSSRTFEYVIMINLGSNDPEEDKRIEALLDSLTL